MYFAWWQQHLEGLAETDILFQDPPIPAKNQYLFIQESRQSN